MRARSRSGRRSPRSYNKEPYYIRRQLTEGAVRASDKRARFVGVDAYEAAGGIVHARPVRAGRWRLAAGPGAARPPGRREAPGRGRDASRRGLEMDRSRARVPLRPHHRPAPPERRDVALTDEEQASHDALRAEYDGSRQEYADAEEFPDEVDQRLGEIETALAAFDERPVIYDPAEIARAGVFVSIDTDGGLRIERGYVRPEDEAPVEPVEREPRRTPAPPAARRCRPAARSSSLSAAAIVSRAGDQGDEDDGIKPLSERLVTELTAHRTLALRDALANDPDTAFVAVLHALCLERILQLRRRYLSGDFDARSTSFNTQAPGLADSASAKAIEARHQQLGKAVAHETRTISGTRWSAFDGDSQAALFAHCASLTVNAVHDPWNRSPRRHRPCRHAGPGGQSRHGGGRLVADRRQLSRPGHQGAHPRGGARGEGRGVGAAHRPPQEARHGEGGRAAARRRRLAARAAAHTRRSGGHGRRRSRCGSSAGISRR